MHGGQTAGKLTHVSEQFPSPRNTQMKCDQMSVQSKEDEHGFKGSRISLLAAQPGVEGAQNLYRKAPWHACSATLSLSHFNHLTGPTVLLAAQGAFASGLTTVEAVYMII